MKILNLKYNQLINKSLYDENWFLVNEDGRRLLKKEYPAVKVLTNKKTIKNDIIGVKNSDQSITWLNMNAVAKLDSNNEIESIVVSFVDISDHKNSLAQAYKKTYFNSRTKLPNILSLEEKILENSNYSLIILQIDEFTKLSQYYNNQILSDILQSIAKILKKRFQDEVYHIETNKFAILSTSIITNYRIKKAIDILNEEELYIEDLDLYLRVTAGCSNETNSLILTAQAALSKARVDSLDYYIYLRNDNLFKEINNEIFWSQTLRKAIKKRLIKPVYQGIIDNKTLDIYKYEVLMRIELDNKLHTPGSFLEISKKLKIYKYLTIALLEQVFEFFKNKNIHFSINLNTEDLMSERIKEFLLKNIQNPNIGKKLTIEIVESEGIKNFEAINRFLNVLKIYSCKIAIDDFGSGYSNFHHILKLDADYIKIDGSLILDICHNQDSQDIVKTMVSFAKLKNLKTVAEFVSSEEIFQKVKELGVDYSQGFFFLKPENTIKEKTFFHEKKQKALPLKQKYKQLIYSSVRKEQCPLNELNGLFKKSSQKNKENQITGFLICDGINIMQIIEGEIKAIDALYAKILKDNRHHSIRLIGEKNISNKEFFKWSISYLNNTKIINDNLFKLTGKNIFTPNEYDYDFSLKLLKSFFNIT